MKKLSSISIAFVTLLALVGCAPAEQPRWQAGNGPIKIVASTNVWGSVANLVAGDLATVDAIIYNVNQDPHSYELTARDKLLINNADIVIMNGGGYDDFVQQAVDADPTPAITVDAYMASGDDENRNEHIWYDVDQVGDVAAVIGAALESVDESKLDEIEARVEVFREKLAERKSLLDENKAQLKFAYMLPEMKCVFMTEPLVAYLAEDAGWTDLTPTEFSEAIEEERDVPPSVMQEAIDLIKNNKVGSIYVNASTKTGQIETLLSANKNIKVYEFSELLNQDPDTLEYEGDYFEMLDGAIALVIGK
jgi:zinc/manganese transport system substrate-binding protein